MTGPLVTWLEQGRRNLQILWGVVTDRRVPWAARLPALLGLAYVASPIDLIPDWLPFGSLDDAVVLAAATALSMRCIPSAIIADHRARATGNGDGAAERGISEPWPLYWAMIAFGVALSLLAAVAMLDTDSTSGIATHRDGMWLDSSER